ncbi:hypothetical protein D3874_24865 [Oleomonas cavernae]|uniref:DUF2157 domain-containing protein n=1 Tax=Oleomonas cavernae TaxID=2320859 RepID=A0A418WID7_9PROT|nr:hypothetical protein [Oleomonas cavernae]RJF89801.1 hypothetical protein D3874_24865 [Oleomonas cavernae]
MKVTLDLDVLVVEGKLTPEEAERLATLGRRSTGMLAFNLLVGFGVLAVAAGVLALVPAAATAIAIGLVVAAVGLIVDRTAADDWGLLAQICIIVGALIAAGGALTEGAFGAPAFLAVALVYGITAVLAGSNLLAALAILAVSGAVGAQAGYLGAATYGVMIPDSSLAIVVMLVLGGALLGLSRLVAASAAVLARVGAATAMIVANFGFWVGSLWGDEIDLGGAQPYAVPEMAFIIAWAVVLLVVAILAARAGARWTLNCAAIFGAIHLYTQWFERLDATPEMVLAAGLVALGLALGLAWVNRRLVG